MDKRFLLIAFESDKPKEPSWALRKTISVNEFLALKSDSQLTVDLNEIPHEITGKRSFVDKLEGYGILVYLVIDVKRIPEPDPVKEVFNKQKLYESAKS